MSVSITYEVLAFRGTEEKVLAHVPRDIGLTISTTTARGLEPTLDLAVRLRAQGYRVAPHLVARLVCSPQHLAEIVDRLRGAGVDAVFVVGGDAPEPAGEFPDALSLLTALGDDHPFTEVGIAGYPEGHALIEDDRIDKALREKEPYATQVITQMCFDAGATMRWVRENGSELPVRVGIPGAISRQKLVRISATLGLGQSARFLAKQQNLLWRFFLPGGYSPNRLLRRLAPDLDELAGLHVFTFNELAATEAWRRSFADGP